MTTPLMKINSHMSVANGSASIVIDTVVIRNVTRYLRSSFSPLDDLSQLCFWSFVEPNPWKLHILSNLLLSRTIPLSCQSSFFSLVQDFEPQLCFFLGTPGPQPVSMQENPEHCLSCHIFWPSSPFLKMTQVAKLRSSP